MNHLLRALAAAVMLTACHPQQLTRERALELLRNTPELNKHPLVVEMKEDILKCGTKAGAWEVTWPLGIVIGSELSKSLIKIHSLPGVKPTFETLTPVSVTVVAVTGITDLPGTSDGTAKEVEYTYHWNFGEINPLILECLPHGWMNRDNTNNGRITMKLYDDGWRVLPETDRNK